MHAAATPPGWYGNGAGASFPFPQNLIFAATSAPSNSAAYTNFAQADTTGFCGAWVDGGACAAPQGIPVGAPGSSNASGTGGPSPSFGATEPHATTGTRAAKKLKTVHAVVHNTNQDFAARRLSDEDNDDGDGIGEKPLIGSKKLPSISI
jgi:hypothetical protein